MRNTQEEQVYFTLQYPQSAHKDIWSLLDKILEDPIVKSKAGWEITATEELYMDVLREKLEAYEEEKE